MPVLGTLPVGVFYWIGPDPAKTVGEIAALGAEACQLAVTGETKLTPQLAAGYRRELDRAALPAVTVFAAYTGEIYADVASVEQTVGFLPWATRAEREIRTREVIEFGAEVGLGSFGAHVGCIPAERNSPDYKAVRDMVRRLADYAASYGMSYCLETGQEPAEALLAFLRDVDRSNVRINFDPANMVLYGSGDPHAAFRLLRPLVVTIHGKDGDGPVKPGALGAERPLGAGSVDIARFIRLVRESGFDGSIHVESGVHGEEPRAVTLGAAVSLLKTLRIS
jgi:sugar phosphate isomerase/epimerase